MMELTKQKRRQIAAEEVREILSKLRAEAPSEHWSRHVVLTYGIMELLLRDGEVSTAGLREICEREGVSPE